LPYGAKVVTLGLGGKFADPHVVDHALAQRQNGLSRGGMALLLSETRRIASFPA
jgi:hypothetical protein